MRPTGSDARRPGLAVKLAVVVGATLLPLVGAELVLRTGLVGLPEPAAQYVFGCYEPSQPRRYIHTTITSLQLGLHRPNFRGDCYFAGYAWRHESDGYGWRNPVTRDRADVVVLGDSMIYGHGVDEDQTTTHFLEALTGRAVVNLGITGGSPVHYLAYLRNFGVPLRPRVAVVLTFGNDLDDIRATRTPDQVRRFVEAGEAPEALIYSRDELLTHLRLPGAQEPHPLDVFALFRFLQFRQRESALQAASRPVTRPRQPAAGTPADPLAERLAEIEGGRALEVAYLRRAFGAMAASARDAGIALVVGHLGMRSDTDRLMLRLVQELSAQHDLHYFRTPHLEAQYRLPRDGHLSEAGHRRLAEALASFLETIDS